MTNKHFLTLVLGCILLLNGFNVNAKKKANDKKEPVITRHYLLHGGFQLGVGSTIGNSYMGDLYLKNKINSTMHMYLKLKLKDISIYGGLHTSNMQLDENFLTQSYIDKYSKEGYSMVTHTNESYSTIVTPYVGMGYQFTEKKFEIEPFIRLGVGFQNFTLGDIHLTSNSNANNTQHIYFIDNESSTFFRPSFGINASRQLLKIVRLKGSLVFDAGKMAPNEIQEMTADENYNLIRRRNLMLQNSMNQISLMIGFEITPYNRVFQHEKRYQKLLQRQNQ